jgi:hypothetical protein
MIDENRLSRDDLLDALLDLKHDLGKYIRLPVAMLPADAGAEELRQALATAINQTRKGPAGARSAAEIWAAFLDEVGGAIDRFDAAARLRAAVDRALAWGDRIGDDELERPAIEGDLSAVGTSVQRLIEEVNSNDG